MPDDILPTVAAHMLDLAGFVSWALTVPEASAGVRAAGVAMEFAGMMLAAVARVMED